MSPLPNIDDLSSFIGVPALTDFSHVVNPSTDISAAGYNSAFADIAMASRTIVRAYAAFSLGTSPSIIDHDANWGKSVSVAPVVSHISTGLYNVVWPATVTDALGNSAVLNLRQALAANIQSTSFYVANCYLTAANTMQIRLYNSSIALSNATSTEILVVSVI